MKAEDIPDREKRKDRAAARELKKLGSNLPYYRASLVEEEKKKSRRQALGLAMRGIAFLALWPVMGKESRAASLKRIIGEKAEALPGSLSARQAAKMISAELGHQNVPHTNIAHQNIPHTNTNQTTHVNESKHVDWGPPEFAHTNQTIHTNQNIDVHVNTPHSDNPHRNVPHTNVEHADRPGPEQA